MMQITYQKNNGYIMQKYRNTPLPYKIGDRTSMGWKVLNIEYEYNNKYYSEQEYNMLIRKNKQICLKKKQMREIYIAEFKTFFYILISLLIINLFKRIIGI